MDRRGSGSPSDVEPVGSHSAASSSVTKPIHSSASCTSSADLRLRPGLLAHALDGGGVERADAVERALVQRPPRQHRLRAALFQRRVVEERVQLGVEDPARERRRLGRVDRDALDRPVAQALEHLDQPLDVGRFGQAVVDRLPHERVIHRDRQVARRQVLRARDRRGKRRRQQVARAHPQDLRRHRLAVLEALEHQRPRRVPPPARFEHRLVEHRLRQHLPHACWGAGS